MHRREFLGAMGAGLVAGSVSGLRAAEPTLKKKMAIVTTEWRCRSHAWHMGERFLNGYPINGGWHHPPFEVVSAYVDQKPEGDLSRERAARFGFKIYPTIAEALRPAGGNKIAVDAVLVIGEHGNYLKSEYQQTKYPRYEFFKQVVDVYKADGRALPMFNDKHLSWKWDWAKEMVDTARAMKFPYLAGSSLPVTWRMPSIDMPHGAEIEEAMCICIGSIDSYDFHALEVIQCMVERRRGGETGVVALQALRGPQVWEAMGKKSWAAGGWDPKLFEACLSRTHTLAQTKDGSHAYPTREQMQEWVKDPIIYRVEYADGLKTTMLMLNGLVSDFTFAARLKGESEPISTLFHLPPNPNVVYSAALMSKAEQLFATGKEAYPVERTLLTGGLVEAGCQSLAAGGKRLETPHLAVKYQVGSESTFWQA